MYYVMNRTGTFTLKVRSCNQCRDRDTMKFQYRLRILFDERLDAQGFLIENEQIDQAIQALAEGHHLRGSCEEINAAICDGLGKFFKVKGLGVHAFRVGITPDPTPADLPSWVETVCLTDAKAPRLEQAFYLQALGALPTIQVIAGGAA